MPSIALKLQWGAEMSKTDWKVTVLRGGLSNLEYYHSTQAGAMRRAEALVELCGHGTEVSQILGSEHIVVDCSVYYAKTKKGEAK